jgi:hypothetical protein
LAIIENLKSLKSNKGPLTRVWLGGKPGGKLEENVGVDEKKIKKKKT